MITLAVLVLISWVSKHNVKQHNQQQVDKQNTQDLAKVKVRKTYRIAGETYTLKIFNDWLGYYSKDGSRFFQDQLGARRWFKIQEHYTAGKPTTYISFNHRISGPAVEHTDGHEEYWIMGEHVTKTRWQRKTAQVQTQQPTTAKAAE